MPFQPPKNAFGRMTPPAKPSPKAKPHKKGQTRDTRQQLMYRQVKPIAQHGKTRGRS